MCIYHCLIHIWDHCEWSQDIPSHIIQTLFLNQWHSSIFMSYISSYNKYIVFSCWSWILGNLMIHWNKMEIHQTKNLNKAISILYYLRATLKLITSMAWTCSCSNLGNCYGVYGASSSWKIVLESLFLIVISPSCGLNSHLTVKSSHVFICIIFTQHWSWLVMDIQVFKYQPSFPILCQG